MTLLRIDDSLIYADATDGTRQQLSPLATRQAPGKPEGRIGQRPHLTTIICAKNFPLCNLQQISSDIPVQVVAQTVSGGDVAAPRPAGRTAGRPPGRIAREAKQIRIKSLGCLDSRLGKQVTTGERRRVGNEFRHQRGSTASRTNTWIHDMFWPRGPNIQYRLAQPAQRMRCRANSNRAAEFQPADARQAAVARSPERAEQRAINSAMPRFPRSCRLERS
jgi:hypothetical protein